MNPDIRWLPFRNDSGETIPGGAVLRPTSVIDHDGAAIITVAKPNRSSGLHYINGPFQVEAYVGGNEGYGNCSGDLPLFALYDGAVDTPALGEEWGPKLNSWKLDEYGLGFVIIGGAVGSGDSAKVFVDRLTLATGRKKLVRFTFAQAMTTADASKTATLTDQYGPGVAGHGGAGAVVVHNLLTHTDGVYEFEGDVGDAGLAYHDSGNNYRIIIPECP